jgi:AraC-like DNA-binding protein
MAHRTRFVRLCLGYARAQGLDPATLIDRCGLPADAATAETTELSLPKLAEFADCAADSLGDPDLGVHLASFSQRGDYGVAEYVAVASRTLGEGCEALIRFNKLLNAEGRRIFEVTKTEMVLEHRFPGHPLGYGRHVNEFEFARLLRDSRTATGVHLVPRRVWFAHPRPASTAELERAFEVRPEFGRDSCGFSFDRSVAELPLVSADSNLTKLMTEHARALEQQLSNQHDLVAQVQEAMKTQLQRGGASLEKVAAALKMSGRTLQRKLAERDVSFASVLEELRKREAIRCLTRSNLTVTEIAFVLGYSDVSTFVRAFRGWTEQTPSEFREAHAGPPVER